MAFSTFTTRFSMRTPVWTRSIVTIVPMYQYSAATSSADRFHYFLRAMKNDGALRLETALDETRRFHALRPRRESVDVPPPTQRVDIAEERRVAAEHCRIL